MISLVKNAITSICISQTHLLFHECILAKHIALYDNDNTGYHIDPVLGLDLN